jgi:tRNA threonylcarbamoyladenosine biosynthesis protein TsaB
LQIETAMLILALDTSSASGSAAVARDGRVLVERAGDGTRTHGERLPRELMQVLDAADVSLRDVHRFAVSTGPGSFTGLRVGIATMQGLALAQRKLVSPVSSFEALAAAAHDANTDADDPPLIAVWIDAHRGEVFAALYGPEGRVLLEPPTSLPPHATLDAWAAHPNRIRFTGDGALKYADVIRATLGARAILPAATPLLAATIATIAAEPGRAVAPHAIAPVYVRRSDAELARDRRLARG